MTTRHRGMSRVGLWLALGVACGGSGVHHLGDGGGDAAQTDAPRSADAPGSNQPVTLAVTLNGAPAPGATVYFQNADSTVVAERTTGSDGTAVQAMAAGGFVTLIEPTAAVAGDTAATPPANQGLDTFSAVEPGDVLHVDILSGSPAPASVTFTLTAPLDPDGSASTYELLTTCGEATLATSVAEVARHPLDLPPASVTLTGCNGVADMLVYTLSSNNAALDALYAPGVAVADGSAIALAGSYLAMGTQTIDDANIPLGVPNLTAQHHLVGPHGELVDLPEPGFDFGSGSAQVSYDQVTNPLVSILDQTFQAGSAVLDNQTFVDWGSASLATVDIDAGAGRLPDYLAAPTFDLADQQVQWTFGSGSAVDAVYSLVTFQRAIGSGSAAQTATWSWNVLAPGTEAGAIQLPTLPTDVFAWNGSAGDTIAIGSLEMGADPGGYNAVRALGLDEDFDAVLDTSTPSGHVVLDYFAAAQAVDVAPAVATRPRARTRRHRATPAR